MSSSIIKSLLDFTGLSGTTDMSNTKASWKTLLPDGGTWHIGATEIPSDVFQSILTKNGIQAETTPFKSGSGTDRVNFAISASADGGTREFWSQVHEADRKYDPLYSM